MDDDAVGALAFLKQHFKGKARDLLAVLDAGFAERLVGRVDDVHVLLPGPLPRLVDLVEYGAPLGRAAACGDGIAQPAQLAEASVPLAAGAATGRTDAARDQAAGSDAA